MHEFIEILMLLVRPRMIRASSRGVAMVALMMTAMMAGVMIVERALPGKNHI
jgi:hypothetical protein